MKWEAHVRAPVLYRVGRAVVPKDTYRPRPDLAGDATRLLEVFQVADPHPFCGGRHAAFPIFRYRICRYRVFSYRVFSVFHAPNRMSGSMILQEVAF